MGFLTSILRKSTILFFEPRFQALRAISNHFQTQKSQSPLTSRCFLFRSGHTGQAGFERKSMMTQEKNRIGRSGLFLCVAALGLTAGMAQAADRTHRHGGSGHQHTASCDCIGVQTAGYLTINGCKTRIIAGRTMNAQIANAFREAGYRAWVRNGCVHIDYECERPRVRWSTDDYRASLKWGWDQLSIQLSPAPRYRYQPQRVIRPVRRAFRAPRCGW